MWIICTKFGRSIGFGDDSPNQLQLENEKNGALFCGFHGYYFLDQISIVYVYFDQKLSIAVFNLVS